MVPKLKLCNQLQLGRLCFHVVYSTQGRFPFADVITCVCVFVFPALPCRGGLLRVQSRSLLFAADCIWCTELRHRVKSCCSFLPLAAFYSIIPLKVPELPPPAPFAGSLPRSCPHSQAAVGALPQPLAVLVRTCGQSRARGTALSQAHGCLIVPRTARFCSLSVYLFAITQNRVCCQNFRFFTSSIVEKWHLTVIFI